MHRLFVALVPPADVRAALLGVMGGVPDARWQTDNQLHLTLAFLGDVDRHQANDLAAALGEFHPEPFPLALSGYGSFDAARPGRVGALWIGVQPSEPLAALAAKVRRAAVGEGITPDARKFRPHITLARFPAKGVMPESLARFLEAGPAPSGAWTADTMTLFESRLGQGGAHYEAVAEFGF